MREKDWARDYGPIVLAGLITGVAAKEFRAKAGSSPASRFLIGRFVMIGALVFLGCPLRMVIRLGGGDLTAVAGLLGFLAIWAAVTVGNLVLGNYSLSAAGQPVAHSQYLWSFLGMILVGWGSILLGGCPLRQLILVEEGNGDFAVAVLGMVVGAALVHNFGLAGNPDSVVDGTYQVGGTSAAGMAAVVLGFVALLAVTLAHLPKKEGAR